MQKTIATPPEPEPAPDRPPDDAADPLAIPLPVITPAEAAETLTNPHASSGGDTEDARTPDEGRPLSREQAFARSAVPRSVTWNGNDLKLRPLDGYRYQAIDALGLEIFLMPDEERQEAMIRGKWPGMIADATILACLCAHPKELSEKALFTPRSIRKVCLAWGREHNLTLVSREGMEAVDFLAEKIEEIDVMATEIDPAGSGSGGNGGGGATPNPASLGE